MHFAAFLHGQQMGTFSTALDITFHNSHVIKLVQFLSFFFFFFEISLLACACRHDTTRFGSSVNCTLCDVNFDVSPGKSTGKTVYFSVQHGIMDFQRVCFFFELLK